MTELQAKLVNMLSWYHDFCEKHHLRYYIIAGTMLGAVRHGGFIPWDDDIDVGMPRRDYEKLRELCANQEKAQYMFEYPSKENKSYPFLWAKLFDTTTTIVEKQRDKVTRGIYIDVFPLDGIGDVREQAVKSFQPIKKKAGPQLSGLLRRFEKKKMDQKSCHRGRTRHFTAVCQQTKAQGQIR